MEHQSRENKHFVLHAQKYKEGESSLTYFFPMNAGDCIYYRYALHVKTLSPSVTSHTQDNYTSMVLEAIY